MRIECVRMGSVEGDGEMTEVPYGLVARISDSHSGGRGSIPRGGSFLTCWVYTPKDDHRKSRLVTLPCPIWRIKETYYV